MFANIFGTDGLIVVVVALVVLFGGSQLPKLAKNVGSAGKEFRKAQQEAEEDHLKAQAAVPIAPPSIPPVAAPAPVVAQPVVASDDDKLVISRSELKQELGNLLDERDKKADH